MCLCNVAICSLFIDDGQHSGLAYVSLQVVVGVIFLSLLTGDLLSGSFQLQGIVCLLMSSLICALMSSVTIFVCMCTLLHMYTFVTIIYLINCS